MDERDIAWCSWIGGLALNVHLNVYVNSTVKGEGRLVGTRKSVLYFPNYSVDSTLLFTDLLYDEFTSFWLCMPMYVSV